MMRAIWTGAVAFGLVNVPVKLYAATGEHEVPLHQTHRNDGGRIRYVKTCSVCHESVELNDIAKGFQSDDGSLVVLTDEDLADLPLATEREIAVLEFVPAEQVDPIMLGKTYFLEPEKSAAKPYALLREALATTERMAVVKVALRQRESMAVLRVRGDVICLQTLLWPDEVRAADFAVLDAAVVVRPQELTMAASLVESLAADFDPSAFEDSYQQALESLIEAKMSAGGVKDGAGSGPARGHGPGTGGGEVVDLLAALERSVEKARAARSGRGASTGVADGGQPAPKRPAVRKPAVSTQSTAAPAAQKKATARASKKSDASPAREEATTRSTKTRASRAS